MSGGGFPVSKVRLFPQSRVWTSGHSWLPLVSGQSVDACVLKTSLSFAGRRCRKITASVTWIGSKDSIRRNDMDLAAFIDTRDDGSNYV